MKRSDMLILIANQLDFLNGTFTGVSTSFTSEELARADVILTTLEDAGMLPPETIRYIDQDNGNTLVSSECLWEPEDEN